MNSDRIKMLEQFAAEDPGDPFNAYALALEWAPFDKQKAKEIFDKLLNLHPEYLPAYYQTAILYLDLTLNEQATKIIEKGIALAKQQRDAKTLNELSALLEEND